MRLPLWLAAALLLACAADASAQRRRRSAGPVMRSTLQAPSIDPSFTSGGGGSGELGGRVYRGTRDFAPEEPAAPEKPIVNGPQYPVGTEATAMREEAKAGAARRIDAEEPADPPMTQIIVHKQKPAKAPKPAKKKPAAARKATPAPPAAAPPAEAPAALDWSTRLPEGAR